ncbi:hypothetical protein [Roseateles sp.]|uniref:hypothetical protein n=1 Tax=Roseateles sp. TaxID=1971397 RepID=UPI0031D763F9
MTTTTTPAASERAASNSAPAVPTLWLQAALNTITGRLGAERALSETQALVAAIPAGVDVEPLGSALILRLLDEVVAVRAPEGELAEALATIRDLHRRCLAGEELAATAWKAPRRQAVEATDRCVPAPAEGARLAPDDARLRGVGLTIEAAAWDPRRSASAVSEVLRQWLALEGLKADAEFGWTNEDDARVRRLLAEMHAKYLADKPEEKRTVFDFLEIDHDDVATRLRAHIKHGNQHGVVCCERACALLRRLLAQAC